MPEFDDITYANVLSLIDILILLAAAYFFYIESKPRIIAFFVTAVGIGLMVYISKTYY